MKSKEEIYKMANEVYGTHDQTIAAIEEMAELQQILSKILIKKRDIEDEKVKDSLLDEIADVSIMMEQLSYIYNIKPEEIETKKKEKILRFYGRILNAKLHSDLENI